MKFEGNSNHCTNMKHQNRKKHNWEKHNWEKHNWEKHNWNKHNWIKHNWNKSRWNIKISTWLIAFLVSFLLAACSSREEGFLDSTGVVNSTTESGKISDTGTADDSKANTETNPPSEGDYASSQEGTSKDKPDEDNPEAETPAEDGAYSSKEDVAYYLHLYGHLPSNFITKKEAEKLGWKGGSLESFAPGKCIGGNRFGNYEGLLPEEEGRFYTECDIDTMGADKRGAKRIVFSNDGLIYYTEDHYKTFELLYGEE